MSNDVLIQAQPRTVSGKQVAILRTEGYIPAVVYGFNIDKPINVQINERDFLASYKLLEESSLIDLSLESKKYKALIKDVSKNSVKGQILSIDFYIPNLKVRTILSVALEFIGEAPAVKNLGGTLVKAKQEIEVEALPTDLPELIQVDVSQLSSFEDIIRVKDLKVNTSKVTILDDLDEVIAMIGQPQAEEEPIIDPLLNANATETEAVSSESEPKK